MRYKLIPTLIAAGQTVQIAGFPIVARGDLFWPDQTAASDNTQYIHLNSTLVAPIWDSTNNITSRSVWIPPGSWQDAWDGSIVTGPKTISVSQPYEQIPMWHRRGTFLVTVDSPARRVEEQDWSVLTLEVFPDLTSTEPVRQTVYNQHTAARTDLTMEIIPKGEKMNIIRFTISKSEDGQSRGWIVRLHLLPGQTCEYATEDNTELSINHLPPVAPNTLFFPFAGAGTRPASNAGHIAEITIPQHSEPRNIQFYIQ